jgi:glycosyltransferase involved in cell wall biosynthesis
MVSVIIPTYNREATIARSIDSVLCQTYSNTELIIVDDGSTDGTRDVLASYGNQIIVIRQANCGPSAARNHGSRVAKGSILSFLDSDDTWHPEKLERQMQVLNHYGKAVTCCICNCTLQSNSRKHVTSFGASSIQPHSESGIILNPSDLIATRFILFNQVIAVRRQFFDKVGGFNESLWLHEDHDLALRLSVEGPWGFVTTPLVAKNESNENLSGFGRKDPIAHLASVRDILDRFLCSANVPNALRPQICAERQRLESAIQAHRLAESPSPVYSLIGNGCLTAQRVRSAIRRRSPWWPKAKIQN